MLVDTSNKLLANALRLRLEPAIENMVGACQRGFLRGRSIEENVVSLDAAMQETALEWDKPTAFLFDMRAAFPSLEHGYLHKMLELLGLPGPVRATSRALYAHQRCCLSMAGGLWPGFAVSAGIRQGCPLNPVLFALLFEHFLPTARPTAGAERTRRAYADDLTLVAEGGRTIGTRSVCCFLCRGVRAPVELVKVGRLLLWTWRREAAQGVWEAAVPEWVDMRLAHAGTHLGFEVGPQAEETSRRAPIRKFRDAVLASAASAHGMLFATVAYNTYVFPELLYVAQIHGLAPEWNTLEQWAVQRLFLQAHGGGCLPWRRRTCGTRWGCLLNWPP